MSAIHSSTQTSPDPSPEATPEEPQKPIIEVISVDAPETELQGGAALEDLKILLAQRTVNAEQLLNVIRDLNEDLKDHGISTGQIMEFFEKLNFLSDCAKVAVVSTDKTHSNSRLAEKAASLLTDFQGLLSLAYAPSDEVAQPPVLAEVSINRGDQAERQVIEPRSDEAKSLSTEDNERLSELRQQNDEYSTENRELSAEIKSLKAEKARVERQLTEARRLEEVLKKDKAELASTVADLNEDVEKLTRERGYLSSALDRTQTEVESTNQEELSEELHAEIEQLKEDIRGLEEEAERLQQAQAAEVANLNDLLDKADNELKELRRRVASKDAQKEIDGLRSENANVRRDRDNLLSESIKHSEAHSLLRSKYERLVEQRNNEKKRLENQIEQLQRQIADLRGASSIKPTDHQSVQEELRELKVTHEDVVKERDELHSKLIKEQVEQDRPYVDAAKRMVGEAREVKQELCELLGVDYDPHIPITELQSALDELRENLTGKARAPRTYQTPQRHAPQAERLVASPKELLKDQLGAPSEEVQRKERNGQHNGSDTKENEVEAEKQPKIAPLDIASQFIGFATPDADGIKPDHQSATELTQKLIEYSEMNVKDTSILLSLCVVSFREFRYTVAARYLETHLTERAEKHPAIFSGAVKRLWDIERTRGELVKYSEISPTPNLTQHIWDILGYAKIQDALRRKHTSLFTADLRSVLDS